jgi:hypothetical protein
MTTLAAGSSVSLTLANNGFLEVSTGGGFGSVTITPTSGVAATEAWGPSPFRKRWNGPYPEGAAVTLTNTSSAAFDYETDSVSLTGLPASVLALVSKEGNAAPQVLVQTGIPFILGSSGSITDSGGFGGALAYTTALPVAYGWSYCYFPVDRVLAGKPAGWYLTNMTAVGAGTIYDVVYAGGQPSIPTALPRIGLGSPGAFTQTTGASDIPAVTCVIPADSMGANGAIEYDIKRVISTSGDVKQNAVLLNGVLMGAFSATTPNVSGSTGTIHNRGTSQAQVSYQATNGDFTASGVVVRRRTVDTTVSQVFAQAVYILNVLDYVVIESCSVILRPKA